jgi:ABC-2 type transport system ATP-binding protein
MNPVFRLEGIVKRYRGQLALDNVSLSAEPGQVVALLGENGAGKTTALKILLGLIDTDAGFAEVFGLDSRAQGLDIRRRVGYVPDHGTMYDWMTVAEAGWFAAGFYGPDYLANYHRLIKNFGLETTQKIKTLSRGMQAKVGLATAMAHQPDLLVLDEPTSGLDPIVRREFLQSMVDVAAEGRTVLLSSHQIAEVERVADRVAILRKGKLVAVERLEDLKQQTWQLTITLRNGSPTLPKVSGTIIHQEQQDRHYRLLVRDADEAQLSSVGAHESVGHVDVRRASLEEIFVGFMQPGPTTDDEPAPAGRAETE